MEIRVKINIVNEEGAPFMGPGPLRLLEMIEKKKSINKAAKEMGLSYVKALRMLKRLEDDGGQKMLIKRTGGADGGGAELTAFAKSYIREYSRLEIKMRALADREFNKFSKRTLAF